MAADGRWDPSKFRIYWASRPAPRSLSPDSVKQLIPVDFSTEEDAVHAAALLLRAKQHVWLIERPHGDAPMESEEIKARCEPLLEVFGERRKRG